jgi:ABC-type nitrate/sulfonate/bicarbonate transport system substrate-binding protein
MMALRMPTAGPTTGTLPQYVASEMGFFREEGLEPTFVTVSSGAAMLPAVISGQVDASPSGLVSDVKAIQAGQDIRMVSGWTVGRNYFVLVRKGVDLPVNGTFEEKMRALDGRALGAQGGPGRHRGALASSDDDRRRRGSGEPADLERQLRRPADRRPADR